MIITLLYSNTMKKILMLTIAVVMGLSLQAQEKNAVVNIEDKKQGHKRDELAM